MNTRLTRFIAIAIAAFVGIGGFASASAQAATKLTHREVREAAREIARDDTVASRYFEGVAWVDQVSGFDLPWQERTAADFAPATFENADYKGKVVPGSFDRLGRNAALMTVTYSARSDRGTKFSTDRLVLIREYDRGRGQSSSVI